MAGECLVIALIIGVLCVGFFRAKRKNWAFAVLPMGLVPLVFGLVMYFVTVILKYEYTFILPLVIVLVSLIASCIWIGMASTILIKTKKMKIPYIAASVCFVFGVSLIILVRYYLGLQGMQ